MYEDYQTYRNRILQLVENRAGFPPAGEMLGTSAGLEKKFAKDGRYKPFYGDTFVFTLSQQDQLSLAKLQSELYACAATMLSEKLPPETLHITLHDLHAGNNSEAVAKEVERHKAENLHLLPSICKNDTIHLKAVGMVSIAARSLVMLFVPSTVADYQLVQERYQLIDSFCPLSYPLTLHCTLAYYKPGAYKPETWHVLEQEIAAINVRAKMELEVDCSAVQYQYFSSMQDYHKLY